MERVAGATLLGLPTRPVSNPVSDPSMAEAVFEPPTRELDSPLFAALMVHCVMVHAVVSLARVAITYRTIELDLSIIWLGAIATAFSVMPIFAAVALGRFIDRGNDCVAAWLGAAFLVLACAGLWLWPNSAIRLFVWSMILGVGQLFSMAAQQVIAVRCAGPRRREWVFGYFMVAIGVGQGLGPTLLSLFGGSTALPPTQVLFAYSLGGAILTQIVALALRPAPSAKTKPGAETRVPVAELLKTHGMFAALWASVITVTAFELLVIYLPLLGTERNIDTRDVGLLLAVRSLVSIFSRIFYVRLIELCGRVRLMVICLLTGGAAFALMGVPTSLPVLYVAVGALGFGLGIAATLSFSEVVLLAPHDARATALSLRITGNRLGQVVLPFLGSFLATVSGGGGVLIVTAAMLAASGVAVRVSLREQQED
jgi:MFS family permease